MNDALVSELQHFILTSLNKSLVIAEQNFLTTAEFRHNNDLKSEGKYDSRALEAGMLAGAQKKRLEELKNELEFAKRWFAARQIHPTVSGVVKVGDLIVLSTTPLVLQRYLLLPFAAGLQVSLAQSHFECLILSSTQGLGRECLGAVVGETIEFETPTGIKDFALLATEAIF